MPFSAYAKSQSQIVQSWNRLYDNDEYTCQFCSSEMSLVQEHERLNGQWPQHFRHKNKCDIEREAETANHLQAKKIFYAKARLAYPDLKITVDSIKIGNHVPDLIIGNEWAIEVQYSPINEEEVNDRNSAYKANGYTPFWAAVDFCGKTIKESFKEDSDWLRMRLCNTTKALSTSINNQKHLYNVATEFGTIECFKFYKSKKSQSEIMYWLIPKEIQTPISFTYFTDDGRLALR